MLEQCSPCIRSEGDPASSQAKKTKTGSTGLWLRPVSRDQMHPVVTPGVLDLSRVDRTPGGSVRSLPPERPVNRNRAVFPSRRAILPTPHYFTATSSWIQRCLPCRRAASPHPCHPGPSLPRAACPRHHSAAPLRPTPLSPNATAP